MTQASNGRVTASVARGRTDRRPSAVCAVATSPIVEDNDQALTWLRDHVRPGDVVLLKASRAAALETVGEALVADHDVLKESRP